MSTLDPLCQAVRSAFGAAAFNGYSMVHRKELSAESLTEMPKPLLRALLENHSSQSPGKNFIELARILAELPDTSYDRWRALATLAEHCVTLEERLGEDRGESEEVKQLRIFGHIYKGLDFQVQDTISRVSGNRIYNAVSTLLANEVAEIVRADYDLGGTLEEVKKSRISVVASNYILLEDRIWSVDLAFPRYALPVFFSEVVKLLTLGDSESTSITNDDLPMQLPPLANQLIALHATTQLDIGSLPYKVYSYYQQYISTKLTQNVLDSYATYLVSGPLAPNRQLINAAVMRLPRYRPRL